MPLEKTDVNCYAFEMESLRRFPGRCQIFRDASKDLQSSTAGVRIYSRNRIAISLGFPGDVSICTGDEGHLEGFGGGEVP